MVGFMNREMPRVHYSARRGLTLVEMLFSIAILLAGMVGIAAVLGVAGKNAASSRTITTSQSLSNNALDVFLAYRMNSESNWVPTPVPVAGVNPIAVCIDPIGRLDSGQLNFGGNTLIPRVSQKGPTGAQITGKMAQKIFLGEDEPVIDKLGDSTLPMTRVFESGSKASIEGAYSWFAMMSISGLKDSSCVVSIISVKNRDFAATDVTFNVRPVNVADSGNAIRVVIDGFPIDQEQLRSGDWIMLNTVTTTGANGYSWYRVVSVSVDDQGTGSGAQLKAMLSGKQLPSNLNTSVPISGTFVGGVVNVHERVVTFLP